MEFQLTHLLRGATPYAPYLTTCIPFQLTHLLRGATKFGRDAIRKFRFQLTHLLRGATGTTSARILPRSFQLTHLLRGATRVDGEHRWQTIFQLTHLLRGATYAGYGFAILLKDFNSRTSCEVRPFAVDLFVPGSNFNSRTSCEVRPKHCCDPTRHTRFQLTHLLRGATSLTLQLGITVRISTHAPLARCDVMATVARGVHCDFNSRTSCEVRL